CLSPSFIAQDSSSCSSYRAWLAMIKLCKNANSKRNTVVKYCALDIETAKCAPAGVRDWGPYRPLGIACASTLLSDTNEQLLWFGGSDRRHTKSQMAMHESVRLVEYLKDRRSSGYTVLTWNGLRFDFDILAEESGLTEDCKRLAIDHTDMMFH